MEKVRLCQHRRSKAYCPLCLGMDADDFVISPPLPIAYTLICHRPYVPPSLDELAQYEGPND